MRVERNDAGEATALVVSRRNLQTLIAKLDGHPPNSACTIGAPSQYGQFEIRAEEDDVHYDHPSREEARGLSGIMHPDTERALSNS